MNVRIEQSGLGDRQALIIAEKMRSIAMVEAVTVQRGRRAIAGMRGLPR